MRDGQAGLGHPPWRGEGGMADLNALRLDASANNTYNPIVTPFIPILNPQVLLRGYWGTQVLCMEGAGGLKQG